MTIEPVKGYRPLTDEMVAMANQNKLIEELVLRQVDRHVRETSQEYDQRWVAIARTKIQEGFMALNRAVFKPTRIQGPVDVNEVLDRVSRVQK